MTTEGWIFMVGFRVFDVGLLVGWLIWFLRLKGEDDPPEGDDDGGQGPAPEPHPSPGGGGMRLPLGSAAQGRRVRDGSRPQRIGRRGARPARGPLPARVRRPRPAVPSRRY